VKPAEEIIGSVGDVVNEHIDGTQVLHLLNGIAEMNAVA
jgi:hypothetical protein